MNRETTESKPRVVFIVSQPRAGSTLFQTMLAGHPSLLAPGETWLMLPLVHAVGGSSRAVTSPYDGYLADDAISIFAQEHLVGGVSELQHEIGLAASRIYEAACQRAGADVLIDKTPRYYWIIEELLRLIPNSRVILLLRNPLAVMSSIIATWTRPSSIGFLSSYRADLLEAPARLANASLLDDSRIETVSYENLVSSPETVLGRVQQFIGVDVVGGLANYGAAPKLDYGDPEGIHRDSAANRKSIDKWVRSAAESAAQWRLLNDYRLYLGQSLLGRLGYSFEELGDILEDVRPRGSGIAPSLRSQISGRPVEPVQTLVRARRLCAEAASRIGRAA